MEFIEVMDSKSNHEIEFSNIGGINIGAALGGTTTTAPKSPQVSQSKLQQLVGSRLNNQVKKPSVSINPNLSGMVQKPAIAPPPPSDYVAPNMGSMGSTGSIGGGSVPMEEEITDKGRLSEQASEQIATNEKAKKNEKYMKIGLAVSLLAIIYLGFIKKN